MIRPTFMGFETAKKAITLNQMGIDVTGQNISNLGTEGYTRQRIDRTSISSGSNAAKYSVYGVGAVSVGQGVQITGVSQIRDKFLDIRYRREAADNGQLSNTVNGLKSIQNIFDEIVTDSGISSTVRSLIAEFQRFSEDASSSELATVVRSSSIQIAQMLKKYNNQLELTRQEQIFDLEVAVGNSVNVLVEKISYLNEQIREDNIYGNPSNELNDQRNMLIDQLSSLVNIRVSTTPEKISESVSIDRLSISLVNDNVNPPALHTLVDNGLFYQLGVDSTDPSNVKISLNNGFSGGIVIDNITNDIIKGELKGYLDVLNGHGIYAEDGENNFRGIPYYQKVLDNLAQTFASSMNKINGESYTDKALFVGGQVYFDDFNGAMGITGITTSTDNFGLTGKVEVKISDDPNNASTYNIEVFVGGKSLGSSSYIQGYGVNDVVVDGIKITIDPLKIKTGTQTIAEAKGGISASSIKVSQEWMDDPMYITTSKTSDYGTSSDKTSNSANDNIFKFIDALGNGMTFLKEDGTQVFNGSLQEYITSFYTELGLDIDLNENLLSTSDTVMISYMDARDSISAVSLEEECINLMSFQSAFTAASKFLTALDDMLNVIINEVGTAGR